MELMAKPAFVPAQADRGGAFDPPLSPQAAAALGGLLATDVAAGALCGRCRAARPRLGARSPMRCAAWLSACGCASDQIKLNICQGGDMLGRRA